jgi:integrase
VKFTQSRINNFQPPAGKIDHDEIDEAMPGFGVRYRNGGTGTFFIKFKIGDKHGRLSLGKVGKVTLADAQAGARKHFAAIAEKIDPSVERARMAAKASDSTGPLIDDFMRYLEISKKRNGKKRSLSYLKENERTLRVYCKGLHRLSAGDINRAMVAKIVATVRDERGPIAADRSRAHLSAFFTWTIAEGRTEINPVAGTNKTGSKARERVLQDSELLAIWNALGSDDYGDIARLLILTGARRDEIGSLRRGEINFAQKQIELPGARTKNGVDHIVPLSPLALSILQARAPREGSDFVFGRGQGGFGGWGKCKARLDARLDLKPWVLHDFRRALSTTMHDKLQVPPHIVEVILGHVGGHRAGVGGVYNKAQYLDQRREALERYANHIKGLTRARLAVVK